MVVGLVGLLLGKVQATEVMLVFAYPPDLQHEVRFVAHVETLRQGRAQAWDAPVAIAWTSGTSDAKSCQDPALATDPETVCAVPVCLEPGVYTVRLFAQRGEERSPLSGPLDLDLQEGPPCFPRPGTPVSTPPSLPLLPLAPVAVLPFVAPKEPAMPTLPELVNRRCVQWKITGPCLCNPTTPCVTVEYWEPAWLVELVKQSGRTTLPVLGEAVQAVLQTGLGAALGGGGAANASGTGQTNLHFTEARVYTFPQLLGSPCTGCAPVNALPQLLYVSELDPTWRTATAPPLPPPTLVPIGVWGMLFPRGGKVIHGSEPVASALAAVRALAVTATPVAPPPFTEVHTVLQPTPLNGTCLQLAHPKQTPCLTAGTPPPVWESGALSPTGAYLWVVWTRRTCCVNPTNATCGLTLPGVGGHGDNLCVLP